MKNFNLIEWLQTDSHGKQSATRDHHGTKSWELSDNPRPLRYPCATFALPLRYVAMIFAVLTLSIANIDMAWGATFVEKWQNGKNESTKDLIATFTLGTNASISSSRIQIGNGTTGSFTWTIPTGYTITSVKFVMNSTDNRVSSFTATNGTVTNTATKEWTYTPSASNIRSETFTVSATGAAVQVSEVWVTFTDGVSDAAGDYESLYPVSADSSTPKNVTFTSSAATTSVTSITTENGVNNKCVQVANTKKVVITASKNIKYILFSWNKYAPSADSKWTANSGSYAKATYKWTPANTTTKSVTFTRGESNTAEISNIHIVYYASAACGETAQAALTLSSSSGTICGTGTATFTVSGGSGSGALSVSSSAPSKATASISGSTVTVTGVAAGSATITVTKACDATYAEKTATYAATVAAVPTANAGADKVTEPGTGVALAATAAASGCTGAWTIQSGPNTSTAQLSSTSSATATFTPTVAGTYTLRWTVTNTSSSCSAYDEMKVTAAICSISDCGNATLTYPLNVGTSLINTAANLVNTPSNGGSAALTVPAANAAVTLSTITISDKDGDNDNNGKAAAASSACYPTAPTMSSKIGMYNGSSYSSSNYLQFAFTVNSGYTFTPCDIQFTVQPVSNEASFRWEVTDGTNIYGYGTGNAPVGKGNGATVLTGLTSTSEMAAGDYYIRLYPYYNGSNTFRISNNVILKGTTAAAAPSCSDDTGLAYGTGTVNKVYGDASFTNTLTNSNSLSVSYSSSNTDVATVNPSTGAVTIKAAGTTTITATWAGNATYCADAVSYTLNVKPAVGSVSGAWDRFGGETISLSVTPSGGSSYTYQWQKWYNSQWNDVSNGTVDGSTTSGATTNNLQITNCSKENSGSYRCQVTSASQTNETDGYQVKVFVLECYTGGTTVYNFTRDGENLAGSLTIDLDASTAYEFKVHADNDYYGNNGTINSDATNWVLCNSKDEACTTNLTVNSGLGGTFTFAVEYSASGNSNKVGEPEISVTYPRKKIYMECGDWKNDNAKMAVYYWRGEVNDWTDDFMSTYTCDDNVRYTTIPAWAQYIIFGRFNKTKTSTGNWDDKYNQSCNITPSATYDLYTFSGWSDCEGNSSFTNTSSFSETTFTISYNKGTGGSGTKDDESKTCGIAFTLPSSAVFTRTGYTQTGWTTSDGGAQEYALGGTYTTNEDKTFYPVWTVNNYDLTWNLGGGTTTSAGTGIASDVSVNTTSSVAYGTSLTAPTVTKANYDFSAWSPAVASTMPAAATTYTATWTAKKYNVSTSLTNMTVSSGTTGSNAATYGTNYTLTLAADDGFVLPGSITVTIGGDAAPGGSYTYNSSTGVVTITGSYITGAIVITAAGVEDAYTVTYAAGGGSGDVPVDDNSYDSGDEVTVLGKNTLSKSGYTFCGWSYNGYVYVEGDKFNITESATLTAVWNQNATTVTITNFATSNTNTSNNIPDDNSKYFYGYKGTVSDANALTLTSNDGNDRGQNSGVEMRLTYNKKMRVYANNTTNAAPATFTGVTAISFKWMFIASGNSGKTELTSSYTVKVGSTTVADAVSITGKTNDGYATVNLTGLANLSGYIEIVFGGSSSSYNVYIDDIAITYSTSTYKKVTFNKGSGPSTVSGLPGDRYVPSGSKIAEPSTDPTAANYIFGGWYTTSACSTTFDFTNTTITTDKTIYAKWTAKASPGSGTVSGTTSICSGSNTNVTISTSVSGASYQLYKDNVASGDPKPGTGSALTWSVSAAGTYTVKAVETATHASGNMSGSATISIYTALSKTTDPTSSKSATVGVGCALDGLTYAGNANVAFQWQTCKSDGTDASDITSGSQYSNYTTATMTFTPASAGTYYFRCVVSDDCGSSFNTSVVTVTAKVAPTVYSVSGTTSICSGNSTDITLSDSDDGVKYQLYKGGVAEGDPVTGDGDALTWSVSAAGTYTVKSVADATYAEATMSGSAVITVTTATSITNQPATSPTGHDGVSVTLGTGMSVAGASISYKWYSYTSSGGAGEAVIAGATSSTYAVTKSAGTYYYKVEVIGSCGSVKSNMITVTVDNKHLLSFNANGGSGSVPGSAYYAPSASVTINSTTMPTRSGYVFLGWNTNNTGTGTMYQPGATYTMPATATTLYAAWGSPCFSFSKGTAKGSEPGDNVTITSENIATYWTAGATLSGGNMTNTSGATLGINGDRGFVMIKSTRELTLTLTGGQFQAGTVIALEGYTNNENSKSYGFALGSVKVGGTKSTESTGAYTAFSQRYVVVADDGIEGTSSIVVKMNGDCTGSQTYLSAIYIGGCMSCTTITPTLSYDNTTIWVGESVATPTVNKDGSTGSVSFVSGNTDVATVDPSTGVVTAVARGTATIMATIAADGTHCGKTATCVITVKDMECGNTTIAKATRSGTSASYSGVEGGSALVNNLDGSNYKLKSGGYVGVQLPSTLSFEAGDIVRIDLTIGDWWNGASAGELPVVVYADNTGTNEIYRTDNYTKLTAQVVEFTVTSSMLTALATKQVTVYRQSSTETQNHVVNSVEIKRYACPDVYVFDAADNGLWSDEDNWIGPAGHGSGLPTIDDRAIITKPITVDIAHATAAAVILDQSSTNTGKLTIEANKGLEVAGTVTRTTTGSNSLATREEDLVLESSSAGNASLIFNNSNGDAATVQMYSKASINRGTNTWNWQYVGTPFTGSIPLYNYYGSWMYKWNNGGWSVVKGNHTLEEFVGYCLTQENATTHVMGGTLVPTTSSGTISIESDMVLANSWTAPIWIGGFTEETFTSEPATIYLFNTGMGEDDGNGNYKATGEGTEAGTYVTVPVNSAPYTGNELIAPMHGFFVTTYTGAAGTITMNYNDLVRPSGVHTGIVAGPMKAPRRAKVADAKPDVMKIWANGSEYNDRVVILAREDFSEGFDNGWDGEKLSFGNASPSVYVINEEGGYDAVSAIPEYEGTLVGFRAGSEDNVYTMTFEYNGDEVLYLNDLKAQMSAEIATGQTYMFTTEEGDSEVRFIISHNPIRRITTGVDEVVGGTKVRKIIINDKVYIIRKGRVYSVDGQIVK